MALDFLTEDVDGVTPARVAGAGYLDGLDLTSETFTVVGYGTDEFITGSAGSPKAITVYDGARRPTANRARRRCARMRAASAVRVTGEASAIGCSQFGMLEIGTKTERANTSGNGR
jgi:hypothetical protein